MQSLMQEQMRQADRQLHNIEATPEGFNRLRQMYETLQVWRGVGKVWSHSFENVQYAGSGRKC